MSYLIDNGHKIKQPDAPFAVKLLNISKVCHNGVNCPTNRTDIARNRIHVFDMKHATIGMYILDLLQSVINVSVQTVDIVNSLPRLKFD